MILRNEPEKYDTEVNRGEEEREENDNVDVNVGEKEKEEEVVVVKKEESVKQESNEQLDDSLVYLRYEHMPIFIGEFDQDYLHNVREQSPVKNIDNVNERKITKDEVNEKLNDDKENKIEENKKNVKFEDKKNSPHESFKKDTEENNENNEKNENINNISNEKEEIIVKENVKKAFIKQITIKVSK